MSRGKWKWMFVPGDRVRAKVKTMTGWKGYGTAVFVMKETEQTSGYVQVVKDGWERLEDKTMSVAFFAPYELARVRTKGTKKEKQALADRIMKGVYGESNGLERIPEGQGR